MYSDASGSLTQKLISFGKDQINLKSYEISPLNNMNKAVHINLGTEIAKQNLLAETNLDLLTLVRCF